MAQSKKLWRESVRTHHNKLWGLKKLKKITQLTPGIATCAPYKVYANPNQFRLGHAKGMPRLLIRKDEKGRTYRTLEYGLMPREDANLDSPASSRRSIWSRLTRRSPQAVQEHSVQKQMKRMEKTKGLDSIDRKLYRARSRFIIHPTRKRADVFWTGKVWLYQLEKDLEIEVSLGRGNEDDTHYFKHPVNFKVFWENGKLAKIPWDYLKQRFAVDPEKMSKLFDNLQQVLKAGFDSHQIKVGDRTVVLRFNTWKDTPEQLEFYDLIEQRSN